MLVFLLRCAVAYLYCLRHGVISLSLVGDVGGGAGSAGRFWCVGDVAMGDVGSVVLFCFVGWSLVCVALCLFPSAAVLVVASFCDGGALLVAGIVNGVVRVGVCSADAGVFHGPVCAQSSSC